MLRRWLLPIGLYAATAVVVTYPLVLRLGSDVAGRPGDTGFFLWCMDTFWTNVLTGRSPFLTDRIFFPRGANLAHASCAPFLSLGALPFLAHLPLYGALLALASLIVSALGAMLVVRELTDDAAAGIVAGLLYGFGPTLLSLLWVSQLAEAAAAALIPFGVLFLLRFWKTAGWRQLGGLGAVIWALLLTQFYMAVAFFVLGLMTSIIILPARLSWRHLARAALFLVANAALLAVFVFVVLPWWDVRDLPRGGDAFTSRAVANLADVLVPSLRNPLLGWLYDRWATDRRNYDIDSYFAGWGLLLLAIVGLVRARRRLEVNALAMSGLVLLLLACGTKIRIGNLVLLEKGATPFAWLARLPTLEMLNAPRRLVIGFAFVAATLAGVGIAILAGSSPRRRRAVLAGALALFLLEYGQLGMLTTPLAAPRAYQRLAALPGERTLYELGGGLAYSSGGLGLDWGTPSAHLMFWQTVHRKPRIGGYVARLPRSTYYWFNDQPVLGDLLRMTHAGGRECAERTYDPETISRFVTTFNLGYVIIPPPPPRQQEYATVVEGLLAGRIASKEALDGYLLYVLADTGMSPLD